MKKRRIRRIPGTWLAVGLVSALVASTMASAGSKVPRNPKKRTPPENRRSIPMKTLGGLQFWGDLLFFHGWRIQQNVLTKEFRLLDEDNYRHAGGTYDECKAVLEEIKKEKNLPEMSGKAVIMVHGIFRSSKSFQALRDKLKKEGYQVFGFEYPSTRVEITDSAEYLKKTIESLEGIEEINFVVHSMGGLVVRSYLSKQQDKRINRMVMMGVPNLGAHMADRAGKLSLYHTLFGPAGKQLMTGKNGLADKLPIPEFEFAVLAGSRGDAKGYNPLIPGDDDGTVSVSNTRLPGATDFMTIDSLHSFIMFNEKSIDSTLRFLKTGRLRQKGEPRPIPRPRDEEHKQDRPRNRTSVSN